MSYLFWHQLWRRLTGRCEICSMRKPHHRFGCPRRPGRQYVFSMKGKP